MQQGQPEGAMVIFEKCVRALSDPSELLAALEEQRREREEVFAAAAGGDDDSSSGEDEVDEDEPEEYRDKWDEIQREMMQDGALMDDDGDDCCGDYYYYYGEEPILPVISVPVNAEVIPAVCRPPSVTDGVFKLFDQAFVTTSLYCDDRPSQECPEFIRSFLWYNMGLCLHQQQQLQQYHHYPQKQQQQTIEAALRYYGMSLRNLEQRGGFRQGPPEDALLLLLALYNNVGHIRADLSHDVPGAMQCVKRIKILLTTAFRKRSELRRLEHSPEMNFFRMAAICLPDSVFATAGAA